MMIRTITARIALLVPVTFSVRTALTAAIVGLVVNAAVAGTAVTHTVQRGDTLYSIARVNGIAVDDLSRMNKLGKKSVLKEGQVLKLYTRSGQEAASTKTSVASKSSLSAQNKPVKVTIRKVAPSDKSTISKSTSPKSSTANKGIYPQLASSSAIVVDANTGQAIYAKNADSPRSIASITKLMTAMVALDANPAMQETISITDGDVDYLKKTTSRLPVGTKLSRYEMLRLSLMSSENRAASSLSHHYPGGHQAFINAMNSKAAKLGMSNTRFYDATGLSPRNVSTAEDLVKMVRAASLYTLIHEFTTTPNREVAIRPNGTPLQYKNTNVLVRELADDWNISISKTGYTQEAGRCLVMMATVANRKAVMVMLDSEGKLSPIGDANRLKDWIESGRAPAQVALR